MTGRQFQKIRLMLEGLLKQADEAIRDKDEIVASAAIPRFGELKQGPEAVFEMLEREGARQALSPIQHPCNESGVVIGHRGQA